ncbi:MAG: hypothetical protein IPQ13_04260 [Holophagaceae bacterium]|nr:hypothetical protein [Holophagaceae bacterium]
MQSIRVIQALILSSALTFSCSAQANGTSKGSRKVAHALTKELAGAKILAAVKRDRIYKTISPDCLFADFEEETKGYFQFAVRFNPTCCGVRTESTLLNRFAVLRPTGEIVYWDESDPESFKTYASFLAGKS